MGMLSREVQRREHVATELTQAWGACMLAGFRACGSWESRGALSCAGPCPPG